MAKTGSNMERVDAQGRAYAGSQLQIQIYVSCREPELTANVATALTNAGYEPERIRWVSPLEKDRFEEKYDGAFLDALGLSGFRTDLSSFWPKNGPHWDGLAVAEPGNSVLLIEAKSYPTEVRGGGCGASTASRKRIVNSLEQTKEWAKVSGNPDWLKEYYQYANRLAHVYFLRKICGIDAWLVNLCFIDDVPPRQTSLKGWQQALPDIKQRLGFPDGKVPFTVDVFLLARNKTELHGIG